MGRITAAVVGPGDGATETDVVRAEQAGRLLAEAGAVVVTGGMGGVMAAASRGAAAAGGVVVGLLPGADARAANEHVTVAVPTGLGEMRNALVVRAADVVVAIGGSWGTLSEVALAVRTGVPVVAVGGWTVVDAGGAAVSGPEPFDEVDAAVTRALELAQPRPRP